MRSIRFVVLGIAAAIARLRRWYVGEPSTAAYVLPEFDERFRREHGFGPG